MIYQKVKMTHAGAYVAKEELLGTGRTQISTKVMKNIIKVSPKARTGATICSHNPRVGYKSKGIESKEMWTLTHLLQYSSQLSRYGIN